MQPALNGSVPQRRVVTVPDTIPTSLPAAPPTRKVGRVVATPSVRRDVVFLRNRKWTIKQIMAETGLGTRTVYRILAEDAPQMMTETNRIEASPTLSRQHLREQQKELLMQKFHDATSRACDLAAKMLEDGDTAGFLRIMGGLEKLDRISGNTVGEGQKIEVHGPVTHIDIKLLLAQILGRTNGPDAGPEPRRSLPTA